MRERPQRQSATTFRRAQNFDPVLVDHRDITSDQDRAIRVDRMLRLLGPGARLQAANDMAVLPRTSTGVRDVLLRRFVHPASLGAVVDREHACCSRWCPHVRSSRVRPSWTPSAARRDAADREPLDRVAVSSTHLRSSMVVQTAWSYPAIGSDPNVDGCRQGGGRSRASAQRDVEPDQRGPVRARHPIAGQEPDQEEAPS